jgi:dTMP kinase
MKGRFISFEGSEGCGKSTQSRMLYAFLKREGFKVLFLREPGGTKISEKIRSILLDARNDAMAKECEMLLYMAARSQVVHEVIAPALAQGKIVICDRFLDSTLAYQGFGLGIDKKLIRCIGKFATNGLSPDLTILLDLPVEKGLKHREKIEDRIEKRSYQYHLKVRQGYLTLACQEPGRIKVVKVDLEKSVTQKAIRKIALELLKK